MFSIIVFLVVLIVFGFMIRAIWRRVPEQGREDARKLFRELRILTGTYDLKCVMEFMRSEMLGSAIHSVTRSYVPNKMHFGLHPRDARRWGGYATGLARELHDLMSHELASRPNFRLLGDGRLRICVYEDHAAEPGRPSFVGLVGPAESPGASGSSSRRDPVAERRLRGAAISEIGTDGGLEETATAVLAEPPLVAREPAVTRWTLRFPGRPAIEIGGEMTIGRDPTVEIVVNDPMVSREHARISVLDGRVSIVDLDSTHGTFINEQPIQTAVLEPGDSIRLGTKTRAALRRCN